MTSDITYHEKLEKLVEEVRRKTTLLKNAQYVDIVFNCPRGEAKAITQGFIDDFRELDNEKPFIDWIRSKFDATLILPLKDNKPVVILKRLGRNLSQLMITIEPEEDAFIPIVNSYLVCWKGELWGELPNILYENYSKLEINSFFFFLYSTDNPKLKTIELPLKLLLAETTIKLKESKLIKDTRDCLRSLGIMPERRGKVKTKKPIRAEMELFILKTHEKFVKQRKKVTISKLLDLLNEYLIARYPDQEHDLPSTSTVSRLISPQKKK